KVPTTCSNARYILEQNHRHRISGPCFEHEPDTAQRQFVQGLVPGRLGVLRWKQAAEAFAWSRQEDNVGRLVLGGGANILRHRLCPSWRRLMTMPGNILVTAEQISHGTRHADELAKIFGTGRINVHAAQTNHAPLKTWYFRPGVLESSSA